MGNEYIKGDARRKGLIDRKHFDADELHWYGLDVVRQKEYLVGLMFNRRGCATFIPTDMRFRKKNRYAKGKLEVASASFPGTVFVGFPEAPNWFEVMSMNLVNGTLSYDDKPRRIDTASRAWIEFRGRQLDGSLRIERHKVLFKGEEVERSAALVHVQGRGVIRSHMQLKRKAGSDRPVVIRVAGERGRIMRELFESSKNENPQPVLEAA